MILYISKPLSSIPRLLELITHFGMFLDYRINWTKSDLIPIRVQNFAELQFPLKPVPEQLTYLGITATKQPSSLFKANFPPLIAKLKLNIEFWSLLPISINL